MTYQLIYFACAAAPLLALAATLVKLGVWAAPCPATGAGMRIAATALAAGYLAIGGGGIILIAAGAELLSPRWTPGTIFAATGLAWLCLGLGFSNAVVTLRALVRDQQPAAA
jgi:hypothetical protein